MISVSIIGYKNHALRLINIIQLREDCLIKYIYHPTKQLTSEYKFTNNLNNIYETDVIFISSPNNSHFYYIMKILLNSSSYIFCEKPPIANSKELKKLENIQKKYKERIFFNFNLRFGYLNSLLTNILSKYLGTIHNINIVNCHGLAFKQDYPLSWRADGEKNKDSILEVVGIHYIDLFTNKFGKLNSYTYHGYNISKTGTSNDSANILLNFEDISISIYISYAAAKINEITIIGTDGFARILNNKLKIYAPRDTFNKDNFFIEPNIVYETYIEEEIDYINSIEESINYFITKVKNKSPIPSKYFQNSISSNKILLDIINS